MDSNSQKAFDHQSSPIPSEIKSRFLSIQPSQRIVDFSASSDRIGQCVLSRPPNFLEPQPSPLLTLYPIATTTQVIRQCTGTEQVTLFSLSHLGLLELVATLLFDLVRLGPASSRPRPPETCGISNYHPRCILEALHDHAHSLCGRHGGVVRVGQRW
jgi:hypothetical protein